MKVPRRAKLLTLEALEDWFDKSNPRAPAAGVSMMDGFLAALVVGPVFIHPEKWIWHVVGDHEKRAFAGTRVQAVIDTVVDHYNKLSVVLSENPRAYAPLFMQADDGEISAEDWANGFHGAMRLNLDAWQPLFATFETAAPLMAILVNCTTSDGASIFGNTLDQVPRDAVASSWTVIREAVPQVREQCAALRAASLDVATIGKRRKA